MIKKAIILAAGKGARMKDLTKNIPKPLIEINGKPFLWYLLNNIKQAGYDEIIIVYGYQGQKMEKFVDQHNDEFNIILINQFEALGEVRHGTAAALEAAKGVVGDENFIVLYGDNLYSPEDLKKLNIDDEYSYICGKKVENWQDYGVLVFGDGQGAQLPPMEARASTYPTQLKDNFLEKIIEKPKKLISDIVNLGLYKFTPDIFSVIKKIEKSSRGEYELVDAINLLAFEKKVKIKIVDDYWLDLGKPEDVEKVSEYLINVR